MEGGSSRVRRCSDEGIRSLAPSKDLSALLLSSPSSFWENTTGLPCSFNGRRISPRR